MSLMKLQQKNHHSFWSFTRASGCDHCYYFPAINNCVVLLCNGKQQLGFFTEAVVQNALVTCCEALNPYNLICCRMFVQNQCNLIIHWCTGDTSSRNRGLVLSTAAQIYVAPLLINHSTTCWTFFRRGRGAGKEEISPGSFSWSGFHK